MELVRTASYLGAGLAMGLGAIGSALGEGIAARHTLTGLARQPATRDSLVKNMLLGQAITETPGIFALVVAFVLAFGSGESTSLAQAAAVLAAGLCVGIGSLGSAVGSGTIAGRAIDAMSRNPARAGVSLKMMIVAQALCQTTIVYALLVSLVLWVFAPSFASGEFVNEIPRAAAVFAAGLCMGLGAVGPAFGTARVGGVAAEGATLFPESESPLMRAFFVGAGVTQTTSIYALLVALLLILVAGR